MNKLPLLYVGALFTAFLAGWQVCSWYQDSQALTIAQAQSKADLAQDKRARERSAQSGRHLENQLQEIHNAPFSQLHAELAKPVFTTECVSPEFVRLYNATAAELERTLLSRKPINPVQNDIAEAKRHEK